ncbi:MAG: hypothetical protein LBU39_12170 [Desulfobulbaceae bacterium]|jgi:hypothetical protein|nr:hypothetical protein [Desulfobulbaceae bacterium]
MCVADRRRQAPECCAGRVFRYFVWIALFSGLLSPTPGQAAPRRDADGKTATLISPARLTDADAASQPKIAASSTEPLVQAIARLPLARLESRAISLKDLGIRDSIVLHAPDESRELYLPTPTGVPISEANLYLDGGYLRGDGGRTTFVVSLDGAPVAGRAPTDFRGDGAMVVAVDGDKRDSGYVRIGLRWSSVISGETVCVDQTAIGNNWLITPSSRLAYRFNTADIVDIRGAFSALPQKPTVMLAGFPFSVAAYDAAWRLEALMMRGGMEPRTALLPGPGDTLDLSRIAMPDGLTAVPAFAALARGGPHRLADEAEAGALYALAPAGVFAPDVLIPDQTLLARINSAFDALRRQIAAVSDEAATAFDEWRGAAASAFATPLAPGELRLARLGGGVQIVLADTKAAAALTKVWTPVDVAGHLVAHELNPTPSIGAGGDTDKLAMSLIGGEPRSFDVLQAAVWDANFDLATVSGAGKVPKKVSLNLAAAPAADHNAQTASVFFNGALIGSQLLTTDGRARRLTAEIPLYAIGATNLLRVVFQRPPDGTACGSRGQGYPAAVLPDSWLEIGARPIEDDFTGMIVRFSAGAKIFIPPSYLSEPASLARLARVAGATGISPSQAELLVTNGAAQAGGPFLAMDVAVNQAKASARIEGDRLTITDRDGKTLADLSGLTRLAVAQVARAGDSVGILYQSVGEAAPVLPALGAFQGDVALVNVGGLVKQFDTLHPGATPTSDQAAPWLADDWKSWGIPCIIIGLMLLLLAVAGQARRRHKALADELAKVKAEAAQAGANPPGGHA